MTQAAPPISGPAAAPLGRRSGVALSPWLYGRGPDVLLGYGLAYLFSVPLLLGLSGRIDTSSVLAVATPYLALAFSTPHYGATILRVYEQRDDRRRYAIFSVWITLALALLFAGGLYVGPIGSLLLTVYVSWSPWHFSGQNYGISVMYLRRRGVALDDRTKRLLYASYVVSAILALISIHIAGSTLSFAAGSDDPTSTFGVIQLGIPPRFAIGLAAALGTLYVYCLAAVGWRLSRELPVRQLAPVALLVATQALWFTLPALGCVTGSWDAASLPFAAIWLSVAHSTQYLWVTCYYVGRSESGVTTSHFLAKSLLAGAALGAPALLAAPGLLGPAFPNAAAVGVLVFSTINLHHFILDGAIWKLRDGRVARALLRSDPAPPEPFEGPRPRHRLRLALLGVGALCIAAQLYVTLVGRIAVDAGGDLDRRLGAMHQLEALGSDSADLWASLGMALEEAGRKEEAIAAFRRSATMNGGRPHAWVASRLAWLLLQTHPGDPQATAEATRWARYLVHRVGRDRPEAFQTLAAAHAAAGRWKEATRAAEEALRLAEAQGDTARVRYIETMLARYRERAGVAARIP